MSSTFIVHERQITTSLHIRQFEAYEHAYKGHCMLMYGRHVIFDDFLSTAAGRDEHFIEKRTEDLRSESAR